MGTRNQLFGSFILWLFIVAHTLHATPVIRLSYSYDWRGKLIDCIGPTLLKRMGFKSVNAVQGKQFYKNKLPRLMAASEHRLSQLFSTITEKFDRSLSKTHRHIMVYFSHSWSYGSERILALGLSHYLGDEWKELVSQEDIFTDLIFHELLHVWLDEHMSNESSFLKKYNGEESDVLEHIPLMALQKMTYVQLDRPDMVANLDFAYRNLSTPTYRRAWEIVEHEGYDAIVNAIVMCS